MDVHSLIRTKLIIGGDTKRCRAALQRLKFDRFNKVNPQLALCGFSRTTGKLCTLMYVLYCSIQVQKAQNPLSSFACVNVKGRIRQACATTEKNRKFTQL